MKTRKFIAAGILIALVSFLSSCEDSGETTANLEDSEFIANNILVGSNSSLSKLRSFGFGGPQGALFGAYSNSTSGRVKSSPSKLFRGRSSEGEVFCMTETWEEDGNGNYRYTIDFGDGCNYYGEWLFGKMVEVGSHGDNAFSAEVTYTNFGGSHDEGGADWTIDGTYNYSGTWEETEDGTNEEDSTVWNYSATYEFSADLTETFVEYGYSDDSTEFSTGMEIITVEYVANGSESMDENGHTVNSQDVSISLNTGESLTSQVDTPLYYDYSCEDAWVYVSGVESGSYTYEGATGTYSIDYGDGTCDNIIVVTENGVSEEIDLEEEWDDWEEDCGDEEDGDS